MDNANFIFHQQIEKLNNEIANLKTENASLKKQLLNFQNIDTSQQTLKTHQNSFLNLFVNATMAITYMQGKDHIFNFVNPRYQQIFGDRQLLGRSLKEAIPELDGQGVYEIYDEVYKTGVTYVNKELSVQLDKTNTGKSEEAYSHSTTKQLEP